MKIKKRTCLWIILVSIFLLFSIIGCWCISYQNKAIEVAQEYLHQKYTEDMQFLSLRFSWIDPCFYHICFSPKNSPAVVFEVLVNPDLSISRNEGETSSDNYYISLFEHNAEAFLAEEAKRIWGEDVEINLNVKQKGVYAYLIPDTINDTLTLTEMASSFDDYSISIIDNAFSNDTIALDVEKLFEFIQFLQQNNFYPQTLSFSSSDTTRAVTLTQLERLR